MSSLVEQHTSVNGNCESQDAHPTYGEPWFEGGADVWSLFDEVEQFFDMDWRNLKTPGA